MIVPEEISMIVSSDPKQGAVNKSADGSYFEIGLQDGLMLPADALNINIAVEESTIWWTVPNIITGENDKMYFTGPGTSTKSELGFPATTGFEISQPVPGTFQLIIQNSAGGMPSVFGVGYDFEPLTGNNIGQVFTITSDITGPNPAFIQTFTFTSTSTPLSEVVSPGDFKGTNPSAPQNITIPQGLYDLTGLNASIARELELIGSPAFITLNPDEATQKVEMRFNFANVSVDFTQPNTFADILGFDKQVYGPFTQPTPILAPNVAAFNTVNYFLVHSDLTNKGIRFNNSYNQTIGQVLIDVPPGSQITSQPRNPAKINAPELAGATRTTLRFWLTDDANRRVNTNNEYWSARIVIHYLRPFVIGAPNFPQTTGRKDQHTHNKRFM
mgnify:CR=1 FL=1